MSDVSLGVDLRADTQNKLVLKGDWTTTPLKFDHSKLNSEHTWREGVALIHATRFPHANLSTFRIV